MIKKFTLLFVLILLASCDTKKKEIIPVKPDKELGYEMADIDLEYDAEKINLLSIIKNVPHKKIYSVLREYLAKTYYGENNSEYYFKIIDTISSQNDLSKGLTASIIFSYKYEMLTKEEVGEEYFDNNVDQYIEDLDYESREPYEPY